MTETTTVTFGARQLRWLFDHFPCDHRLHRPVVEALAGVETVAGHDDPAFRTDMALSDADLDAIGDRITNSAGSRLERQIASAVCAAKRQLEDEAMASAFIAGCGLRLARPDAAMHRAERLPTTPAAGARRE